MQDRKLTPDEIALAKIMYGDSIDYDKVTITSRKAVFLQPDNYAMTISDTVYMDSESPRARTVELARYHWHRMYSLPRHIEFHRTVPGYWEVDAHDSWVNDGWPTMTARQRPMPPPAGPGGRCRVRRRS